MLREGRKIQLCAVTLLHEDVVGRARDACSRSVAPSSSCRRRPSKKKSRCPDRTPGNQPTRPNENPNAFIRGLTLRVVQGNFREPGPAAIWFRVERPLFAGQAPTPLQRVAMIADFCNGVSTVLDFRSWTFINGDLTISLARLPVGEWILLDAQTWLGDHGAGIAFAKLGDSRGYFGRAIQSLVIEPSVSGSLTHGL